jgi:hypothetical protein
MKSVKVWKNRGRRKEMMIKRATDGKQILKKEEGINYKRDIKKKKLLSPIKFRA